MKSVRSWFAVILFSLVLAPLSGRAETPAATIETQLIEYQVGDQVCEGFLARPNNLTAATPGVLVIHEWYGLNEYARTRARQLAEAGYVAFAGDIYGKGRRASTPEEAGKLVGEFKADRPLLRRRAEAALQVLREQPNVDSSRLAAIGYCFGGMTVLELARGGGDLAGVVSFHGGYDTPLPASKGDIRARILICHGAADPYAPAATVRALEEELTNAGADWQFISYSGAVHAFTNPDTGNDPSKGAAYNAAADRRSWAHMMTFFNELFAK
jgi:dienelactone hydrolase